MENQSIDFDGFWKEALESYFQEFVEFFFAEAYAGIDWSRKPEFLDKELQQVTPDSEIGNQRVDKLVKVWLQDGEEAWVLAHVEVQSQHDSNFAKRVYTYNHRLFDRFDRRVASFAILGDEGSKWKPSQYSYRLWGTEIKFKFSVVKLQEYGAKWTELEASNNPFATVVMAHLKAQETRYNDDARQQWKWTLTRMLYEKGYSRGDIQTLYRFIDWVMQLPEKLEERYWQQVQSYEEEQKVAYVSYAERRGLKQGLEQGLEQAAETFRETLLDLLTSTRSLSTEQLESVKEQLGKVSHLATFRELTSLAVNEPGLTKFHAKLEEAVDVAKEDDKLDKQKSDTAGDIATDSVDSDEQTAESNAAPPNPELSDAPNEDGQDTNDHA